MIYENLINFKKLVKTVARKNDIAKNIMNSIIFCKFEIFFIKNNVFCFITHD